MTEFDTIISDMCTNVEIKQLPYTLTEDSDEQRNIVVSPSI